MHIGERVHVSTSIQGEEGEARGPRDDQKNKVREVDYSNSAVAYAVARDASAPRRSACIA